MGSTEHRQVRMYTYTYIRKIVLCCNFPTKSSQLLWEPLNLTQMHGYRELKIKQRTDVRGTSFPREHRCRREAVCLRGQCRTQNGPSSELCSTAAQRLVEVLETRSAASWEPPSLTAQGESTVFTGENLGSVIPNDQVLKSTLKGILDLRR